MTQIIGLIAGNRKFPLLFSEAARRKGYCVVAVAIKGDTSPKLKKLVDKIFWISLKEYSRLFEIFKAQGVTKVVMAGQISPHRLFSKEIAQSPQLQSILQQIKDKKADTIFSAVASQLKEAGLELLNSTLFIEEYLPKKGVLTRRAPSAIEEEDIKFGLALAKEMGALDIGQTVAVKEKAVVAVEALEGTDNLIRRAGRMVRGGIVVVKVSKPNQDIRFDIPVVGLGTVKNLVKAKASCLAIEAGKTLFIDREAAVKLADKHKICLVAV
ncbi:MAG: UDP-2,3-diacylglucosamine diphosphatase LpxI [Candidatus Omnitrophica bacterium]|nr:UDP-2,3-diacylglucosamine diphosphatase LpxI [Candidatus Omnitrophota bacterium]